MQTLWQDLRYAVRLLAKNPGFLAVAVITLAMAIAANSVVFGVLNALILHPLPMPNANTLWAIQHGNEASLYQSYPDYLDLRDRNRSFEDLAAFNIDEAAVDAGDSASRIWLAEVSGNYFDLLGVQPFLGRVFHASDEHGPNSAPYIVLGYSYWHTHFQDDRNVVGRVVQLSKHPFTVVGVAPPEFHGTLVFFDADLFIPIVNAGQLNNGNYLVERGNRWVFMTLGHLKAGVGRDQAIADLNSIGSYLEQTYPKEDKQRTFTLARPSLYGDYLGRPMRAFMGALMLLAVLILLAACANLGGLFAARAADRSRELALRLALGAGRLRILRQLFTEAGLLSFMGGAVGIWGSTALLHSLSLWRPASKWPEMHVAVNPDANVYGVALLLTLMSGILFGAVPVRQVLQTDPYQLVKSGSLGSVGRRITIRDLLLGVQIAICAVLITSSFVAVRGLARSLHSDFGFKPEDALLVDTDLNLAGYRGESVPEMQQRMLEALKGMPEVESVGLIDSAPLVAGGYNASLVFADEVTDLRPSNAAADSFVFSISPEYFRAAGTTLLSGRTFTRYDDKEAPFVAVVNEFFARKVLGSPANVVGRYFKKSDGTRIQVVGVVEDGKYDHIAEDPHPAIFLPILQAPTSATWLVIRSNIDPALIGATIRSSVRNLDASLPIYVTTWSKGLELSLFPARMAAISLGVMGLMGAMLSITGIFGMAAYLVTKRLRELGIRMALGAQSMEVLRAALGRPFRVLAFGSGIGLFLGILASRVLAFIVYQASPRDPLVLTGVVLAMGLLGVVATWIPAQRALSIDPAILMREE
jgi:predicted permease